jgi:hypothetical protein
MMLVITMTMLLFAACRSCKAQSKVERQRDRQLQRLKCDSINERRYIEGSAIDIDHQESEIRIWSVNDGLKTYSFCRCSKDRGKAIYEVSNDHSVGMILIDEHEIIINLYTLQGEVTTKRAFKKKEVGYNWVTIKDPLKKSKGKQT